jgi:GNAT superfamily N-acetyltransferase
MPHAITIRAAQLEDAPAFLDLVDALADYEELARPSIEARERLVRDGFGDSPRFKAYLGEVDGRAVGYAITFHTYSSFLALPTLYLEDLFVLPDARRMGIGSAFFRHLAREALLEGCGRMEWVVLHWNQLAIDFYERLGAKRLSEWQSYRLVRDELERVAASSTDIRP